MKQELSSVLSMLLKIFMEEVELPTVCFLFSGVKKCFFDQKHGNRNPGNQTTNSKFKIQNQIIVCLITKRQKKNLQKNLRGFLDSTPRRLRAKKIKRVFLTFCYETDNKQFLLGPLKITIGDR